MTLSDEIAKQLNDLSPEKQTEVLNFIANLQRRIDVPPRIKPESLKAHVAFGSWKEREINAITYQQHLRDEWGNA